jgi:ABC-type branched-subunit amino acid transport system substrate-binding protein
MIADNGTLASGRTDRIGLAHDHVGCELVARYQSGLTLCYGTAPETPESYSSARQDLIIDLWSVSAVSKRWLTERKKMEGLLFNGAPTLLRLLDRLVRRPWRYGRQVPLPLFLLVRDKTMLNPLEAIADRLASARGQRVAVAHVGAAPTPAAGSESVAAIRHLLDRVVDGLTDRESGRLRFPHYSLVVWLTELTPLPGTAQERRGHLVERLGKFMRERGRIGGVEEILHEFAGDFGLAFRLVARLLPRLALALMRFVWRPPRWVTRQAGAAIRTKSFYRLADRFVESDLVHSSPAEVRTLLVEAFLEDLRRAYRRTTILGAGRRRTTYPVLLLDDVVTGSAGFDLLNLLTTARNAPVVGRRRRRRRYLWDPLLAVGVGGADSRDRLVGRHADTPGDSTADAEYAYDEWAEELDRSRHRTWILPLTMSPIASPEGMRNELGELGPPVGRRPWMSLVAGLTAATVVLSVATTVWWDRQHQCNSRESGLRTVEAGRQCIGHSTGRYKFFGDPAKLDGLNLDAPEEKRLADDLKKAEETLRRHGERVSREPGGHVRVVYLGVLTAKDLGGYKAALEELKGLIVALKQNDSQSDRMPIKVELANAGTGMAYGQQAARAIVRAAEDDPRLVGVVGMGLSKAQTREAIQRLGRAQLPMLGTVITATDLATKTSPFYYQVGPTNEREAATIAAYAQTVLGAARATVYHSGDEADLYSGDLARQLEKAFEDRDVPVELEAYTPDAGDLSARQLGQLACDTESDGVVVYAGRSEPFTDFVDGLRNACESKYPRIIAGDDVTRFVLSGHLRTYPGLAFDYVSFASSTVWGSECADAAKRVAFFAGYRETFGGECANNRDGQAMLAYDALTVIATALTLARSDSGELPSRELTAKAIADISDLRRSAVAGASGRIDYGAKGTRNVPTDKAIMILHATGDAPPQPRFLCGRIATARSKVAPTCPEDGD